MMSVCPHCHHKIGARWGERHLLTCPERPDTAAKIKQFLSDTAYHGTVIRGAYFYQEHYEAVDGLPSPATLKRHFGNWAAVARWAGLEPYEELTRVRLELVRAELHRLSDELYDGIICPSAGDWQIYSPTELPREELLRQTFGTWDQVAEAVSLRLESATYYRRASKQRQDAAEIMLAAEMEAMERERERERAADRGLVVRHESVRSIYDWSQHGWRTVHIAMCI